jgi:hypothetical protein
MRRGKRLPRLLVLAVSVAGVSIACASAPGTAPVNSGPLGPPGNEMTVCIPGSPQHADTEALQGFTNSGNDTVTIDAIQFADPRNLKLIGAYVAPGQGDLGALPSFPPPAATASSYDVDWSARQQAAGAHIKPGETADLVLGLRPVRNATARTSGAEVLYQDGSTHYELRFNLAVIITVPPESCSVALRS